MIINTVTRGVVFVDEKARLESFLKKRGLKITRARETVLKAFMLVEEHISAEALYNKARELDPAIGQATVFRTIKLFTEAGIAKEAVRQDGAMHYEHAWQHEHHDHLLCISCGKIIEFSDETVEKAQKEIFKRYGFLERGHSLELLGLCPDCANRGKKKAGSI